MLIQNKNVIQLNNLLGKPTVKMTSINLMGA